jgi:serine/threonine protein kinase
MGWDSIGVTAGGSSHGFDGAPSSTLEVGDRVGRYSILRVVGQGGMGVVYSALDPVLDRRVALKVLKVRSPQSEERLLSEAQAMASLSDPGLVDILDVGRSEHGPYIVMSFVEGVTLDLWQAQPNRTPTELLDVFLAAGQALAAAHEGGVIHRDFKPTNVMVDEDGHATLVDFGLAVMEAVLAQEAETVDAELQDHADTERRKLLGTPRYMAPEQFREEPVSAATDQFSFCVALYETLYGRHPFRHRSVNELHMSVLRDAPAAMPRLRGVPRKVEAVLRRGLQKDPSDRYPTMRALLADLEASRHRRRRFSVPVRVGLTAAVVLPTLAMLPHPAETCSTPDDGFESVWNDAQRQATKAAIERTEGDLADAVWLRIEPDIDRSVERWSEAFAQACALPQDGGEASQGRDETLECLERTRAELVRTVASLPYIDASNSTETFEEVLSVPSPTRCLELGARR